MTKSRPFLLCFALLATSCGEFPRDPAGTLDRVRSEKIFRVGVVTENADPDGKGKALLHAIGERAGARPHVIRGDAEPMLDQLEQGELDLVIGHFEKKSPWATLVTIGPPLKRDLQGKVEFHLAPVMRNGENAWIGLIEREVRDIAPEAQ